MNCKKAEELMMNYMDNTLSPKDAEKLNEHLINCKDCKESFFIYEMVQDTLENNEIIEAPIDFEKELMIKISDITPVYLAKKDLSIDCLNSIVWGSFTMLLGTGIMLNIYNEPIMNYIEQNEAISNFYNAITPLNNVITESINNVFVYTQNLINSMGGVELYAKIVCGLLITLICFLQVWVKQKDKVDA